MKLDLADLSASARRVRAVPSSVVSPSADFTNFHGRLSAALPPQLSSFFPLLSLWSTSEAIMDGGGIPGQTTCDCVFWCGMAPGFEDNCLKPMPLMLHCCGCDECAEYGVSAKVKWWDRNGYCRRSHPSQTPKTSRTHTRARNNQYKRASQLLSHSYCRAWLLCF